MVPGHEVSQSFGVQGANWFRQISKRRWIAQIKDFRAVVVDHPGENGVLRQIECASLGIRVEQLQVFEVREVALDPLVSVYLDVGLFGLAGARQVLGHTLIYLVSFFLRFEAQEQSAFFGLA